MKLIHFTNEVNTFYEGSVMKENFSTSLIIGIVVLTLSMTIGNMRQIQRECRYQSEKVKF